MVQRRHLLKTSLRICGCAACAELGIDASGSAARADGPTAIRPPNRCVPRGRSWRDYDAEDTLRFYALRLQEVGPIKSSRQKIMADGTDWRFFNELKRELKA